MTNGSVIYTMIENDTPPHVIKLLVDAGMYTQEDWDEGIRLAEYYDDLEERWRTSLPTSYERAAQFIESGVSRDVALNARQEFVKEEFVESVRSGATDPAAKARYQALYSKTITEPDVDRARNFPLEQLVTHRNHMAKCPFHNEKTASLHITGNLYHCFGCHAGGDTISYVRKMHGLGFVDAVRYINSL